METSIRRLIISHRILQNISFVSQSKSTTFLKHSSYITINHSGSRNFHLSSKYLRMTTASGNRLSWKITADQIEKSTEELITKNKAIYDAVGAVSADDASYENVVKVT